MAPQYDHRTGWGDRPTDQTAGFADCGRHRVEQLTEWFGENTAESDRFVSVERGSWNTETVTRWIDTRYTLTQKKAFGSQAACMAAWEDNQFPTHNVEYDREHGIVAHLYSSENFNAYAHASGTGHVEHYATLAAIRTRAGTVFNNSQDYGNGFATLTRASDAEATVPLDTITASGILPDGLDLYDVREFAASHKLATRFDGELWERTDKPELLTLSDGSGLVIVSDPSAKNTDENTAMFRVSAAEIDTADTVADLEDLLVPTAVKESGLDVVPTNQMVPTSQYGRRAEYHTSRYDDRGDVVQRQGEWFFVPVDGLPHATMCDGRHNLPRECPECGGSSFDVEPRHATCNGCGHLFVTTESADHDRVMGNHRPTTFVEPPGNSTPAPSPSAPTATATDGGERDDERGIAGYVRGTVRHTAEHFMARLGDVWHMAVTHGRDVVVVDTSTPTHGRGRGVRWD